MFDALFSPVEETDECRHITTGHYDVVATLEMPSGDAMAKFVAAVGASGNARTTTVRAFTPDEFAKLAGDAPSFGGK